MKTSDIPSPYYRVSLKAIIFDSRARLLVVEYDDGGWGLPGGGWEHGETMQHCLRRELMEELGVGIKHIDFTSIYPYSAPGSGGGMQLKLAVPVELNDYDFIVGDDVVAYKFVTAPELARLDMSLPEVGLKTHIERLWADR